jgi:hypothetical protein
VKNEVEGGGWYTKQSKYIQKNLQQIILKINRNFRIPPNIYPLPITPPGHRQLQKHPSVREINPNIKYTPPGKTKKPTLNKENG